MRAHCQTAGVSLTAQQPLNNVARTAVQALAAVLGGTQSLHTNSFDEAIALPTEKAARLALRTQQVIANETDLTATVDPFAGSYAVEALTDELDAEVRRLMTAIEDLGGAVAAIEVGYQKREIERAAYDVVQGIEDGTRVVVGVNKYVRPDDEIYAPLRVDPAIEAQQCERLATLRAERDTAAVTRLLGELKAAAADEDSGVNLLYPMHDALRARATVGEVCNALREVWGVYQPSERF
jgi:methylmalonyl-CoA mutase N-terminal domain/subunit